jgi:hypothetical protein
MTYGGGYGGSPDPFGSEPFGTSPYGGQTPVQAPAPAPSREANTLATLSIVFAIVFAPAGVVLGHVALAQIKRRGERGRDRALIGLTMSYLIILFGIVALVVWLIIGGGPRPKGATPGATTPTIPPPTVSTTVVTAPPPQRPTVTVEDLRVGQCVEVQQVQPDPTKPGSQDVKIYLVRCEVRDGVFQVNLVTSSEDQCTVRVLANRANTLFACISEFRG